MRLLNVSTLELQEYFGDDIPPYAILSHTWQLGEEVAFPDLAVPDNRDNKIGWKKIEYTCYQAKLDHLQFAWVDTCCIDKRGSAELSEAINSMFAWYSNAEICYVYMSDVTKQNFGATFPASRWFTRGWTLQELLAPINVVFYDEKWTLLGNKSNGLAPSISDITKIDIDVLKDPSEIQTQSAACRMSWASRRTTTRLEDVAYSLMGIFGVNMPLLYGEGDRAFGRLQEEILKSKMDHSLFAWGMQPFNFNSLEHLEHLELPHSPRFNSVFSTSNNIDLFAKSPRDFENCGHIVKGDTSQYDPYIVTNSGLQLTLPIAKTRSETLVLLDCYIKGSNGYLVVLLLAESTVGSSYSRLSYPGEWASKIVYFGNVGHARTESTLLRRHANNYSPRSALRVDHDNHVIVVQTENAKCMFHIPQPLLPTETKWVVEKQQCLNVVWKDWQENCVVSMFPRYDEDHVIIFFIQPDSMSTLYRHIRLMEMDRSMWLEVSHRWNSPDQWAKWADAQNPCGPPTSLDNEMSASILLSWVPGRKRLQVTLNKRVIYSIGFYQLSFDVVDSEFENSKYR